MPITIINISKGPLTFNLALPEHRKRTTLQRFSYDGATGHRYTQRVKVSLGTSLDLLAGESCSNLPDAYENETEIDNALKAKKIRIIKIVETNGDQTDASEKTDSPAPAEAKPEPTETRGARRRISPTNETKE